MDTGSQGGDKRIGKAIGWKQEVCRVWQGHMGEDKWVNFHRRMGELVNRNKKAKKKQRVGGNGFSAPNVA